MVSSDYKKHGPPRILLGEAGQGSTSFLGQVSHSETTRDLGLEQHLSPATRLTMGEIFGTAGNTFSLYNR